MRGRGGRFSDEGGEDDMRPRELSLFPLGVMVRIQERQRSTRKTARGERVNEEKGKQANVLDFEILFWSKECRFMAFPEKLPIYTTTRNGAISC